VEKEMENKSVLQSHDEEVVKGLVSRLAEAQKAIQKHFGGQVDAILDPEKNGVLFLQVAQEALRESEARLRSVIQNAPIPVLVLTFKGEVVFLNEDFTRLTGYTIEDLPTWKEWLETACAIPPAQMAGKYREFEQRRKKTPELWEEETEIRTRTGEIRSWICRGSAIFPSPAGSELVILMAMDITDRKKAEEGLRQAEKELKKLNEDLASRNQELQTANRELEAFSASLAHDLKTPLVVIDLYTKRLIKKYEEKLDARGKEYIEGLQSAGARLSELVQDLFQLSHYSQKSIKREKVDMSAMARAIVEQLRDLQPERQADCRVEEGLVVRGDSRLIKAALENLLGNAWKFTGKCETARIELGSEDQAGQTVYFVRDNGCGFDKKFSDELFLPFKRLHHQEEFPGTGLGLTTVRRIVDRHGGRIWAEGFPGQGATFYFTIEKEIENTVLGSK
jgi:PAS domain S-box-containing protein